MYFPPGHFFGNCFLVRFRAWLRPQLRRHVVLALRLVAAIDRGRQVHDPFRAFLCSGPCAHSLEKGYRSTDFQSSFESSPEAS